MATIFLLFFIVFYPFYKTYINNTFIKVEENEMQEYFKLSQVAKILGVTKATLYNWKNKNKITFTKPYGNNHNYITLSELKRFKEVNNIT